MSPTEFREKIAKVTVQLEGRPLDAGLDAWPNAEHGAGTVTHSSLREACMAGAKDGWLCDREGGGIRLTVGPRAGWSAHRAAPTARR